MLTIVFVIAVGSVSAGAATVAQQLASLPQLDAFATPENPLSGGGRWTQLAGASHPGRVAGSGTSGGWAPINVFPAVHGAFWNQMSFADTGDGVAVAATLSLSPAASERWFSLWLDMAEPERARSGYELRFTNVDGADRYNVTLSKWALGLRTVLATASNYTLLPQSSFALVDTGGVVSGWTDPGGGYGQLLTANDATFARGYVAIEGAGNIMRIRQFRAGGLSEIPATLAGLPVVAAFDTPENPLSGGGVWTQLVGASHPGRVAGSGTSGGWAPINVFPAVHGAFWNQMSFGDEGSGAAVAATLSLSPAASERWFSLWLDMPEPERARSGYELRFTNVDGANRYNVTLSKWVLGLRTVLATASGYTLLPQSSFALVDKGGTVSAWVDAGSGFAQLLSASDAAFSRGYVAIEGAGNIMRIRDFRADASTRYVGGTRIVFDPTTGITTYTPPGGLPRQGYPDAFHHSVTQKDGAEIELAETEDFVTCATSGHRIKIVYSANASGPDAATVNEIRSIVRRSNSKIVRESLRSSNNTRALTMRVDCDAGGSMNVYNVPVSNNAPAAIAATVESRLGRPTGSEAVRYWIFRDAGRHREGAFYVEGETFIPFDDRKTASDGPDGNIARVQTISSVIYKGVTGTNYWQTYTPLHELGHAMGATQPGSPYHTNSGHCTDGLDIMCYEEGHDNYNTTRCPPGTERGYDRPLGVPFDCGYDSYFDAATEPGEWLETHWNVAGPENAFLVERPAEIPPGGYSTEASITLDGTRNGAPGTASVHGHVLRTSGAAAAGSVSVVFDKYVNGNWETMSTAQRTLDANGYYEVVNWSVGAGRWRVHTVFPRQGNYAEAVSAYREFDIQ